MEICIQCKDEAEFMRYFEQLWQQKSFAVRNKLISSWNAVKLGVRPSNTIAIKIQENSGIKVFLSIKDGRCVMSIIEP